jgi:hypothetical protein
MNLLKDNAMHLQAFLWMFLPLFVAGGSAMLAYYIMQARMDVALAKERESLAEARALIQSHKVTMEERIKATEEATRRATMDELMQEIRIEERSYLRDSNTAQGARRSMVMQERVFFRNIPMSNWTEREMVIEEAPLNGLSPRPELETSSGRLEAPANMVDSAGMTAQLLALQAQIAAQAEPQPPPAAPIRVPISKVLEPVALAPAPAPRREPRVLAAVHAGFGAQ